MNSTINIFAVALALCFGLATGCTGEEEKPRPDFMSKPAEQEAASTNAPEPTNKPADTPAPPADVAVELPSRNRDTEPPRDDASPTPTIVIVEGPGSGDVDGDTEAPFDDPYDRGEEYDDDLALEEDDEKENDEQPREEDGSFYYGSTRPFIPPPLDSLPPPPVQNVDVAAPPKPSASQLVKATEPWSRRR